MPSSHRPQLVPLDRLCQDEVLFLDHEMMVSDGVAGRKVEHKGTWAGFVAQPFCLVARAPRDPMTLLCMRLFVDRTDLSNITAKNSLIRPAQIDQFSDVC